MPQVNVASSNLFTERAVASRHSAVEASGAKEHEVSAFLSYSVFLLLLFLRQHVMRPSVSFQIALTLFIVSLTKRGSSIFRESSSRYNGASSPPHPPVLKRRAEKETFRCQGHLPMSTSTRFGKAPLARAPPRAGASLERGIDSWASVAQRIPPCMTDSTQIKRHTKTESLGAALPVAIRRRKKNVYRRSNGRSKKERAYRHSSPFCPSDM